MTDKYDPSAYLPLGSVVRLKDGKKNIMIYGRRQRDLKEGKIYDYIACLHPEGNLNEQFMYLFNREHIAEVLFMGYQDEDEAKHVAKLNEIDKEERQ
jgi:hypothetical protein